MQIERTDVDGLRALVQGHVIEDASADDEGFHLRLDNGRVLVVVGDFGLGILEYEEPN